MTARHGGPARRRRDASPATPEREPSPDPAPAPTGPTAAATGAGETAVGDTAVGGTAVGDTAEGPDPDLEAVLASAARRAGSTGMPFALVHCEVGIRAADGTGEGVAHPAPQATIAACRQRIHAALRVGDTVTTEGSAVVVVAEDLGDEQDAAGITYRMLSTGVGPGRPGDEAPRVVLVAGTVVSDGRATADAVRSAAAAAATRAADTGGFELVDLRAES